MPCASEGPDIQICRTTLWISPPFLIHGSLVSRQRIQWSTSRTHQEGPTRHDLDHRRGGRERTLFVRRCNEHTVPAPADSKLEGVRAVHMPEPIVERRTVEHRVVHGLILGCQRQPCTGRGRYPTPSTVSTSPASSASAAVLLPDRHYTGIEA
ncbi:hypothetical protein BC628DRAFT_936683 [Trametes gibbosa]|nr:hypothetical protein BC628DRAFT_936683 [Trametes gibbosa]